MLTHDQVRRRNRRWKQWYGPDVPTLIKARTINDNMRVAIHLLNPTPDELSRAFCDAQSQLFPAIVIHTKRTFGVCGKGR